MITGHGDDIFNHPDIRINFSSNVYSHFNHESLFAHLASRLRLIQNYPEPSPARVERKISEKLNISFQEVMATSGAIESIYLVAMAFRDSRTMILSPTFSEYADACRTHGHSVSFVQSMEDITGQTETVWLCNPNNPTGTVLNREELLGCIRRCSQTVFVIDASYSPFTLEPLVTPAEAMSFPNVIMIHSMTKEFAVPGLRIGYITAPIALLQRIRAFQMPWSVNSLAQEAALYLLDHSEDYVLPVAELLRERERMAQVLSQGEGVDAYPSQTHILLCRLHHGTAAELKRHLAHDYGILIRNASNFHGLTPAHFRIAVQTSEENDELVAAIHEIIRSSHVSKQ